MKINLICFVYVYLFKKFNDLYIKSTYKFGSLDQFERLLIYRWIRLFFNCNYKEVGMLQN